MKPRIEQVERYIKPENVDRGQLMFTVTWRGEDGQWYFRQASGPALPLIKDMDLRTRLLWSFNAAWLSAVAAVLGVDVAEIELDPMSKSPIVNPKGVPYTSPHGSGNDGSGSLSN
jgi:hypothetical protein